MMGNLNIDVGPVRKTATTPLASRPGVSFERLFLRGLLYLVALGSALAFVLQFHPGDDLFVIQRELTTLHLAVALAGLAASCRA